MGRTGKTTATTINRGQSDKDTAKESVSEDTISKLMKDFTCASLLTKASQNTAKDQRPSVKEAHTSCCEEIVSSLKHFHLKTPVNKRTRLKEKKDLQRKARSALENKYNLSIAAIHSQTSVIWPGKLNCLSSKRIDLSSDVLIRPSRLSIPGITDTIKLLGKASLSSTIHISSSEEKARIAAALTGKNSDFGEICGSQTLSFSHLCNRKSKNLDLGDRLTNSHALPTSIKAQNYRHSPSSTAKHIRNGENSLNHNHSCTTQLSRSCSESLEERISSYTHSSQQLQEPKTLSHTHSGYNSSITCTSTETYLLNSDAANCPSLPSNSNRSNLSNSASSSSITPERSCSEEMRMEESNVNELASYFEDLLHIPRKMSVMAEMMYA